MSGRFNSLQTALVALLPKRGGALYTETLAADAGISLPTVHAEMRPLIEAGVVAYDAEFDQYSYAGSPA